MTEAEAMQQIAAAIREKYGKDIIIMLCPTKHYNDDCPSDDDGNHYPCECGCHAT